MKKNCIEPKEEEKNNNVSNSMAEEVHNALLLSIDGPIDSWVLRFMSFLSHHYVL